LKTQKKHNKTSKKTKNSGGRGADKGGSKENQGARQMPLAKIQKREGPFDWDCRETGWEKNGVHKEPAGSPPRSEKNE